jgi:hypothetical protein
VAFCRALLRRPYEPPDPVALPLKNEETFLAIGTNLAIDVNQFLAVEADYFSNWLITPQRQLVSERMCCDVRN